MARGSATRARAISEMKRRSHRPERVIEMIRQSVGAFLTSDVRDPRIGFVTVIGVEVSPDLSHANVRVSVMGTDEEKARAREGLGGAARYLRAQVANDLSHANVRVSDGDGRGEGEVARGARQCRAVFA